MQSARAVSLAAVGFVLLAGALQAGSAKATFAGGCFWCMQAEFEQVPGVTSVIAGFTGGSVKNPTYGQVGAGQTGHAEAVEVTFDPSKVSYEKLVDVYWENIDPLAENGQFCDRGEQYRTAIFVHDEAQRRVAEESKRRIEERLKAKVATQIVAASAFYPAAESQQDYAKRNPLEYRRYVAGCGRHELLEQIWGTTPAEANAPR
jgi:peptide-methionine (S)-S-oxide reductase